MRSQKTKEKKRGDLRRQQKALRLRLELELTVEKSKQLG
jgi:hypothetical protein